MGGLGHKTQPRDFAGLGAVPPSLAAFRDGKRSSLARRRLRAVVARLASSVSLCGDGADRPWKHGRRGTWVSRAPWAVYPVLVAGRCVARRTVALPVTARLRSKLGPFTHAPLAQGWQCIEVRGAKPAKPGYKVRPARTTLQHPFLASQLPLGFSNLGFSAAGILWNQVPQPHALAHPRLRTILSQHIVHPGDTLAVHISTSLTLQTYFHSVQSTPWCIAHTTAAVRLVMPPCRRWSPGGDPRSSC